MAALPYAIHGHGLLPALLAVHLSTRDPAQPILVLSNARFLGGEHLEPVVVDQLSAVARDLVDPFVVSSWPGYYVVGEDGSPMLTESEVWLLDPVQVWIDLQDKLGPAALIAPCGPILHDGGRLEWSGGSAEIDRLIDLAPLSAGASESEIVGMDVVRHLDLPILADYDSGDDQWLARQYLPLGDERMVMRKLPRSAQLTGTQSTFEALLNALTAA